MVNFDGKDYNDNDTVDFDTAEEIGGFYFSRARYLGLPEPPACFVFLQDVYEKTEEQQRLIGEYHSLFKEAEIVAVEKIINEEDF